MSWVVANADCLEYLRGLPDGSVDSVVTDPPYGLSAPPDMREVLSHWLAGDDYEHASEGFMGRSWDSFVPGPSVWAECLRVLRPGGHLVAFGGTRTYDLMVLAVRLAGFEVRDCLMWMTGKGFPKSLNVSHAVDRALGAEPEVIGQRTDGRYGGGFTEAAKKAIGGVAAADREDGGGFRGEVGRITRAATPEGADWEGWGTALKPAVEPIVLARKPFTGTVAGNVLEHGTGALNIDGCRIPMSSEDAAQINSMTGFGREGYEAGPGVSLEGSVNADWDKGREDAAAHPSGRWPANVLLDEDAAVVLDGDVGDLGRSTGGRIGKHDSAAAPTYNGGWGSSREGDPGYGDSGGPSRFFFTAKVSRAERNAGVTGQPLNPDDPPPVRNDHPTLKPIELMRWLCRLVTPPGGTVLDPFAGSGSTGCAAVLEGFNFTGIELDSRYAQIARDRIGFWQRHPPDVPVREGATSARRRREAADGGQEGLF